MYRDKVVAVIVPAYNEEKLIGKVLETIPGFVDRIVVVDDRSQDATAQIVQGIADQDRRDSGHDAVRGESREPRLQLAANLVRDLLAVNQFRGHVSTAVRESSAWL